MYNIDYCFWQTKIKKLFQNSGKAKCLVALHIIYVVEGNSLVKTHRCFIFEYGSVVVRF